MTLIPKSEVRNVNGITPKQKEDIINFLQGAVYCWCKNKKDTWFSMRDLMGGDNFYWQGTPLIVLFEKHKALGKDDEPAKEAAGKESGWLLKHVIDKDKRNFETKKEELIRKYRWDGKGI